jgi:ABC-type amino acid transport substrate-binding protein
MCTDYPPFESLNPKGEIEGFDVDIANALAKTMNLKLKIVQMDFNVVISSLQVGQIDVGVSAFSYNEERDVLFSDPYLNVDQVMVVRKDSGFTKPSDLSGKKIATGIGTASEVAAQAAVPDAEYVDLYGKDVEYTALRNETVDAVVSEGLVAKHFVTEESGLMILEPALSSEQLHVIVRKGNDLLLKKVNEALKLILDAQEYKASSERWIK